MSDPAPFVDHEFKERPQRGALEVAYISAACLSIAMIGIFMIVRPAAQEQDLAGWAETTISTAVEPSASQARVIDQAMPASKQPVQNPVGSKSPAIDDLFDLTDTGITRTSNAVFAPGVAADGDQTALATDPALAWSRYAVNSQAAGKTGSDVPAN